MAEKSKGKKWRDRQYKKAIELGKSGLPSASDLLHRDIIEDARIESAQTNNQESK